jgi:tetratricopeptide (TPR) repeat protein
VYGHAQRFPLAQTPRVVSLACVFREDYLLRLIHQLADFIAHIAGLNRKGEHDKALAAADEAWGKLIDAPRELIDAVDTPTLAGMLREPAKMRAAAQLFYEEGRALAGKGDPLHAGIRYRRAMELILEARAIDPSDQDDGAILELSRLVPTHTLDPRYRERAGASD